MGREGESTAHLVRDGQHSLALPLLPFLPVPSADYQTLRIGGLVFAVVFFSVGILLILSKFLCSPRKSRVSTQRWRERAAWKPGWFLPTEAGAFLFSLYL